MPTIIWCHGGCFGGGNSTYDKKVRDFLTEQGYNVIAPEFSKNLNAIMDILGPASSCYAEDPNYIFAGVSSGGYLAHIAANITGRPAFLICPVFKPYDRHDSLEAKFQKLQLDFFGTKEEMKEWQEATKPPNNIRQMIFGAGDTRAPVQAIGDWLLDKEMKQITVHVLDGSHSKLCTDPPLDLVLKCVQKCFKN